MSCPNLKHQSFLGTLIFSLIAQLVGCGSPPELASAPADIRVTPDEPPATPAPPVRTAPRIVRGNSVYYYGRAEPGKCEPWRGEKFAQSPGKFAFGATEATIAETCRDSGSTYTRSSRRDSMGHVQGICDGVPSSRPSLMFFSPFARLTFCDELLCEVDFVALYRSAPPQIQQRWDQGVALVMNDLFASYGEYSFEITTKTLPTIETHPIDTRSTFWSWSANCQPTNEVVFRSMSNEIQLSYRNPEMLKDLQYERTKNNF